MFNIIIKPLKEIVNYGRYNQDLSLWTRVSVFLFFLVTAGFIAFHWYKVYFAMVFIEECIHYACPQIFESNIFRSATSLTMFTIILSIGTFIIRTHDKKKEFKDANNSLNEQRFVNAKNDINTKNIMSGVDSVNTSVDNSTKRLSGLLELSDLLIKENFDKTRIALFLESVNEIILPRVDYSQNVMFEIIQNIQELTQIKSETASDNESYVYRFVSKKTLRHSASLDVIYILNDKHTHFEALSELAHSTSIYVQNKIATKDLKKQTDYEKLTNSTSVECRKNLAENQHTPENILKFLLKDKEVSVREAVSYNPNATQEILKKLSDDGSDLVRVAVAINKNTQPEDLKNLSEDIEDEVRGAVASNSNATQEILKKLSNDENILIRERIAKNSNTGEGVFKILINDIEPSIRVAIAKNRNTQDNIFATLSLDSSEDVREAVASNLKTPHKILVNLSGDWDKSVRLSALGNIKNNKNSN